MRKIDTTIARIVKEHESYVPTYHTYYGNKYEVARRGESLIPPRILLEIDETANSLEWKAEDLNKRERRYEEVIKAMKSRKYPIWHVCKVCGNNLVLQSKSRDRIRCDDCKWK
jgi:rubrerythrin